MCQLPSDGGHTPARWPFIHLSLELSQTDCSCRLPSPRTSSSSNHTLSNMPGFLRLRGLHEATILSNTLTMFDVHGGSLTRAALKGCTFLTAGTKKKQLPSLPTTPGLAEFDPNPSLESLTNKPQETYTPCYHSNPGPTGISYFCTKNSSLLPLLCFPHKESLKLELYKPCGTGTHNLQHHNHLSKCLLISKLSLVALGTCATSQVLVKETTHQSRNDNLALRKPQVYFFTLFVLSFNVSALELQLYQLLQKRPSRRFYIAYNFSTSRHNTKCQ